MTSSKDSADDGQSSRSGALTSRSIRSFVIRNGRMTPAQQRAIDELSPQFGIQFQTELLDTQRAFGREAELWVETGFGNGDALLHMAQMYPEKNFLGIEVHAPGVGHLLQGIKKRELDNVRVIRHDAVEVFEQMIAPASLHRALVFFPDPWPKKRHHKRRIVQTPFINLLRQRLVTQGVMHYATDWQPYADSMLELLLAENSLRNLSSEAGFCNRPDYRPATRFEKRGRRLGHQVYDLLFERTA